MLSLSLPSGRISVSAEDGVVVLRGEVDRPELITELEARVRKVQEFVTSRTSLHLPGARRRYTGSLLTHR